MCHLCQRLKSEKPFGQGWKDMNCAPTDGSIIEIENRYGAMPWRNLFRWQDGEWKKASDPNMGIFDGAFAWREFRGDVKNYKDPYAGFDAFDYVVLGKRPTLRLLAAEIFH